MEADFWHQRWQANEIGFHEAEGNALLMQHFGTLKLAMDSRVFVPLCGKTRDIGWLLSLGYRVVGSELSELAVQQLFADLQRVPQVSESEQCKHYSAEGLDIFVGDFFQLTAEQMGSVDLIYDRAALIALPESMRDRYTRHLRQITSDAAQLLIVLQYDQSQMNGPPFSINDAEVERHYSQFYHLIELDCVKIIGGLKGKCAAQEKIWWLKSDV